MKQKYTLAAFILLPVLAVIARNKIISSIFAIAWILLIPVCTMYSINWYKAGGSHLSQLEWTILKIPIALFGMIATFLGAAIILWVFYGIFVEQQLNHTDNFVIFGGIGTGTTLIVFGVYLVRLAITKKFKNDL